jgi:hypothetical protein
MTGRSTGSCAARSRDRGSGIRHIRQGEPISPAG